MKIPSHFANSSAKTGSLPRTVSMAPKLTTRCRFGILTGAVLASVGSAMAASTTWIPTTSGSDWGTSSNWSSSAPSTGIQAWFTTPIDGAGEVQNNIADQNVGYIQFDGGASSITFNGTKALRLGSGGNIGILATLTGSGKTITFNTPLQAITAGGTYNFLNNNTNASNTLVINSDFSSAGSVNLKGVNTGNNTFHGVISNGSSTTVVSISGGGNWNLSGMNTFTGGINIQQGSATVSYIGNQGSAGNLGNNNAINLGSAGSSGTLRYTGTGEVTDRILTILAGNSNLGITLDQSGSGLLKFSSDVANTITNSKIITLQGSTSGAGELAGKIGNGATGTVSVQKMGTGQWTLSGANTYGGTTTVGGGSLFVNGTTSGQGNYTFGTLTESSTLGGNGTIGLASGKTFTAIGANSTTRAIVSPGDSSSTIGTLTFNASGAGSGVTFGDYSTVAMNVGAGANFNDKFIVGGTLNTSSALNRLALSMSGADQGLYHLISATQIAAGSNSASSGGFAEVTGLSSSYRLNQTSTGVDLIHRATVAINATASSTRVIKGTSVSVGGKVTNAAPVNSDTLTFNLSASEVTGLPSSGSATAGDTAGSAFNGSFSSNQTGIHAITFTASGNGSFAATNSSAETNVDITVLNHSAASFEKTTLTTEKSFNMGSFTLGSGIKNISLGNVFNFGDEYTANLDFIDAVGGTLIALSVTPFSGLSATDMIGNGNIYATFDTTTMGTHVEQFTLNFADESGIAGGSSSSIVATLEYTVVPEPGTWGLVAGGLGLLFASQRIRRGGRH